MKISFQGLSLLTFVAMLILVLSQVFLLSWSIRYRMEEFEENVTKALDNTVSILEIQTLQQPKAEGLELAVESDSLSIPPVSFYPVFTSNTPVPNALRVNYRDLGFETIDSIVGTCVDDQKITYPYVFGIYSVDHTRMVYHSLPDYDSKLVSKGFRTRMYFWDADELVHVDELILFFPHLTFRIFFSRFGYYFFMFFILLLVVFCFFLMLLFLKHQNEISAMKQNFVKNMTHEIKTPVSTISLVCQALQDDSIKKDAVTESEYIRIVSEENDRIKQIVNEVLGLMQFQNGTPQPNFDYFDLNETVNMVVNMIQITANSKSVQIKTDLHPGEVVVWMDRIHIGNAISNLLDNALKYGSTLITISTKIVDDKAQVIVQDNGFGIKKSDQKHVFEEFYRVDTGNLHDVKGHGLGLNYVKQVAKYHHGKIVLQSELGEGSTFILVIPAKKAK